MDFGNFLRHPLVVAVAQQAVAGQRFEFGRGPARVSPAGSEPLHPFGAVHFSGTWAGATPGKQYQLTMAPASANGNNGVIITAALADGGVDESCATVADGLQRFFNTLFVDLQGAELRFARLQLAPATGVGSRWVGLYFEVLRCCEALW